MVELPTQGLCSEEQIQSMVRNIFGELLEAEQSGSSSRQHSSVTSEINQAFCLPRNGIDARSSSSVDVSSDQSVRQPPAVIVPQEIISGAVPSFNPQINYNSNFARSVRSDQGEAKIDVPVPHTDAQHQHRSHPARRGMSYI